MIDRDLAALYEVETRVLLQGVKRNLDRFPPDFMFQLSDQDLAILRSQSVISRWGGRILADNVELARKFEALEKRYDAQFKIVFHAIRELMAPKPASTKPIGFVTPKGD